MPKRLPPVAVCTKCGAHTYSAEHINQRCGKQHDGKRCRGCYGSALNPADWQECQACAGASETGESRCTWCDGKGWLYVRQGP
jgi:hypothetical protein